MQDDAWMDLLVLEKKRYGKLDEALDLTKQMIEAVDRRDRVSTRLLMRMRREPIRRLGEINVCEEEGKSRIPLRAVAVLDGEPVQEPEERQLAEQVARNRRLLKKVIRLDQQLSRKIGGKKSYYTGR